MISPFRYEESRPIVFSPKVKMEKYQAIHTHCWKGIPVLLIGALFFFFSTALLLAGSALVGFPLEGVSFFSEIFCMFLLPAIIGIVGVTMPLFFYALHHHQGALCKHKELAEIGYKQILSYCVNRKKKPTKREVAQYIQSHVLLPEYTRRFSYIALMQILKVIPDKRALQSSSYDSLIADSIAYVREGMYMSRYEKEKRERLEDKEEKASGSS